MIKSDVSNTPKVTIGQLVLSRAKAFGKRRFIYRPNGDSVTYEQAVVKVATLAQEMLNRGLKKGDRILCYSEMPDPTIYFFLAAQFIGAVPAPVSPLFSSDYAKRMAKGIGAKQIFCTSEHASLFPGPFTIKNEKDLASAANFVAACEFLEKAHDSITSDDVLMLQPTAGSTGEPKLVIRRHASLLHYANHLAPELDSHPEMPHQYLMLLSFAHSFAYHQFTTAITLGAELAVPWAVDTPVNLHELFQLRPSVLALPPRVLKSFVLQEKKTKTKESVSKLFPSSAEFVVIGGGKGDGTTLRRLVNEGVTPIQIYSTSETSMIAITKKGTWQEESAGKPLSAVDMKIAKDGEILVKSPALMLGYFNLSKTDEEVTSDEGYYPTGDIGSLNETGTLKILGRKKDVFNTPEGSNIFPARIEQLIESLEDVHQVILLGDDYPYICAMVSISGAENGVSTSKDGFLSPGANDELYRKFAPLLQTVNSGLERAEQIIRFYLFSKDFPTSCYQQVQGAKIRRNRREIAQVFSNRITEIYRSEDDLDPSYVPGVERRLRKRI